MSGFELDGNSRNRSKRTIYVNQYNSACDHNLLPLSAGMLAAYAKSIPEIANSFTIKIRSERPPVEEEVASIEAPAAIGFSCYMWNINYSLAVAAGLKERFPDAPIVLGGPSAPRRPERIKWYFQKYPYLDAVVMGEGEVTFSEVLKAIANNQDWRSIDGIASRSSAYLEGVRINPPRVRVAQLDNLPSPFLDGTFDELLAESGEPPAGAIWESNRGCPFSCTFCDWGQAINSKVSFFSLERLYRELDWVADHKIDYLFCADANFGIKSRDVELARYLANLRQTTGYPNLFFVNWTKNAFTKIVDVADILHKSKLAMVVTLAVQSGDEATLKAIKRANIHQSVFSELKKEYNRRRIPTYTDLLLPLPEETYDSFSAGVLKLLSPFDGDYLAPKNVYVLEGSEISFPEYRKEHGIETRFVKSANWHHVINQATNLEVEELVIATRAMSTEEWRKSFCFTHFLIGLHDNKLAHTILRFLHFHTHASLRSLMEFAIESGRDAERNPCLRQITAWLNSCIDRMVDGIDQLAPLPAGIEERRWPYESSVYLLATRDVGRFYYEFERVLYDWIAAEQVAVDPDMLADLMLYQRCLQPPSEGGSISRTQVFRWDWPGFFEELADNLEVHPRETPTVVRFTTPENATTAGWREKAILYATKLTGFGEVFQMRIERQSAAVAAPEMAVQEVGAD